jgi:hypothetical protein
VNDSRRRQVAMIELVMHIVRLMRSGNYSDGKQIRAALIEDFPDETPDQIDEAMREIANRLVNTMQG